MLYLIKLTRYNNFIFRAQSLKKDYYFYYYLDYNLFKAAFVNAGIS